jgi:cytochrome c biogenesis protein CcmG, thiol:disulfide interchange protein DsbE
LTLKHPAYLFVSAGIVFVLVVSIVISHHGKVAETVSVNHIAPRVELKDLTGNNMTIPDDSRGKVVLIHFWDTSCPACVRKMYSLESLRRRYKTSDVIPLSINIGENRQSAFSYLKGIKVSYPVLLYSDMSVTRQYGIQGVPAAYVLDRAGVVRSKILGEITSEGLEKMVRTLL